ncbi:MAG: riboflavin biosynthesis protein RibF, partial [Candidatus Neomarinimicrobiota bacterium]
RKLDLLDRCGVDLALVLHFDLEFSQVSAAEFLSQVIVAHFKPRRIIVGYDHHFGNRRRGNARFLNRSSGKYGYEVEVVAGVTAGERAVSSTAIRELLLAGKCAEAEQLLGWTYEITGRVVRGEGRGAEIGFPTANLLPDEPAQLVPRDGVYVVSVLIDQDMVFGMGNIGIRPTFNGEGRSIETHLFSPPVTELYDRRIAMGFHHRLRDEMRFHDAQELKKQLQQDQKDSLKWIAEYRRRLRDTCL